MCGIAGCVGPSASPELGLRMVEYLRHRGPDDAGVFHEPGVVLAHVRLGIEGEQKQPVVFDGGALVYNGEVYQPEDSMAVLRAYRENRVADLNGMFAFAVWDGQLHLYRDRFGIKPLYTTKVGHDFLFASEVKAFLAHPGFRVAVDRDALAEYWTFQNYLEPTTTLFRGVEMVPPLDGAPAPRKTLIEAISGQRPPIPYGAYISGGLDSGAIASVLRCQTYSVGFTGGDERRDAEVLAEALGVEHYQCVVSPQMANAAMRGMVWHLEEPRMGPCHPNWFAAKLASRFGRVVFSGTGGDELYGGYTWRYGVDREKFWTRLPAVTDQRRPIEKLHDLYGRVDDFEFERRTFLHGLLVLEDKIGMAHSLETRVPFLDNGLWPDRDIGKAKLRAMMREVCPDLADKPKQGFSAHDGDWWDIDIHPAVYDYITPVESNDRLYRWSLAYFSRWCEVWL